MTMKSILKITALLIVLQLTGCGEDKGKSEEQAMTDMLTATAWGHAAVTHSDGDLSDQYTNFTILFTDHGADGFDGNYIISNGGYAFSEIAGKWRLSADKSQII